MTYIYISSILPAISTWSIPFLSSPVNINMEPLTVGPPIQLPVIDISNPNDPAVGKEMLDAATNYGFFYVNSKGSDFAVADVKKAFGLV